MDRSQEKGQAPTTASPAIQDGAELVGSAAYELLTCCLCGTPLAFEQKVDFQSLTVVESSECPSCRIRGRPRSHRLQ